MEREGIVVRKTMTEIELVTDLLLKVLAFYSAFQRLRNHPTPQLVNFSSVCAREEELVSHQKSNPLKKMKVQKKRKNHQIVFNLKNPPPKENIYMDIYISLTLLLQLCRPCQYFFTAVSSLTRDQPQRK